MSLHIVRTRAKRKWDEIKSEETLYMKALKLLNNSSPSAINRRNGIDHCVADSNDRCIVDRHAISIEQRSLITKICGCHRETKLWLVERSDSTRTWETYEIVVQTIQFRDFIEQRAAEGLFDYHIDHRLFNTPASYIT